MALPEKPTRKDTLKSILYLSIFVAAITLGAVLLLPRYWFGWVALVLIGLVLLVNWHKSETSYRCPECGYVYTISFVKDLVAPHGVNKQGAWLLLRCPECRKVRKTLVLKRTQRLSQ